MSKSKRQEIREKRMRQQKVQRLGVIGLVSVGVLFLAAAIIYPQVKPIGTVVTPEAVSRPNPQGNAIGDPNAPIKIEEFSDFQCPYCARFSETTEQQLIDTYVATGKVYFLYRSMGNFLNDNIARAGGPPGTESKDAAEAAYCAGDQNKFWEYHDILFANQTGEAVGDFAPRKLTAYAEALGLDMQTFQSCIDSGKYRDRVAQDGVDGGAAGVTGTPSFLLTYTINGEVRTKLIVGAMPIGTFQTEIEAALAEMGQ
jgi:protein-disulfide isomerase